MEMPFDILNARLGKIRDNGDIDFDNTAAAIDIDQELQSKFLFFPIAELEDLANEHIEEGRGMLSLGQGPGYVSCADDVEVGELFTRAENYLVMYWELKKRAETAAITAAKKKLARRPAPGVYRLHTGGESHTAIVTADQRILCPKHRHTEMHDFTDIFDGLENPGSWSFTPIETGLKA